MSEQNPTLPGSAGHGPRGAIAWMAGNTVAANLLMMVFLVGGLFMGLNIKQEVYSDFTLESVKISVSYPGASPEEVESGIILAVEEAVQDLEGIDEITSQASEGSASITIDALDGADLTRLWQEIKSEVDRIDTFPDEAEDPVITIASGQREVVRLALYGNAPETTMRDLADDIRDRFLSDPAITQVELEGVRGSGDPGGGFHQYPAAPWHDPVRCGGCRFQSFGGDGRRGHQVPGGRHSAAHQIPERLCQAICETSHSHPGGRVPTGVVGHCHRQGRFRGFGHLGLIQRQAGRYHRGLPGWKTDPRGGGRRDQKGSENH